MDPIEIATTLSIFIEELDKLIKQYDKPDVKYQKTFQFLTHPCVEKRDKTKYKIEIQYDGLYDPVTDWRNDFIDQICDLVSKNKRVHKLGLLKNKIRFYETTIIKITVDFDKLQ